MAEPSPKPIQAARLFAALADPTRLSLLIMLRSGGTRPIARLAAGLGMTRQAVTKHLHALAAVGLISVARNGRDSCYTYQPGAIDDARRYLDAVAGRWDAVAPSPPATE